MNEKDEIITDVKSVNVVQMQDDARLAELGYKSEFKREFTLLETIAFAFSIMGIVASVASTMSFPLISGGHVGLVWGWLVPCIPVLAVAACLAEMTSSMP